MIIKLVLVIGHIVFWVSAVASPSSILNSVKTAESSYQQERELQSLDESLYNMTFVGVSNANNTITVTFDNGIGNGDSGTNPDGRFDIYTAPDDVDVTADKTLSCYTEGGELFDHAATGSGISGQIVSIGANTFPTPSTFEFTFDENVTESSPFYNYDSGTTTKQIEFIFCVKFTLTREIENKGSDPITTSTVDINFREVAIVVTVTLDGNLNANSVDAFNVAAAPINFDLDNEIVYTASVGLCETYNLDVKTPQQGDVVPICIMSDDFPLARIISVQDLTFTSDSLTQQIRVDGLDAPGATGLYGRASADTHCVTNECIQYDVIVYAIFATSAEINLKIDITGSVVLAVGNYMTRKLRTRLEPTRELAELFQGQSFRSTIELPPLPSSESAASTASANVVCMKFIPFAIAMLAPFLVF